MKGIRFYFTGTIILATLSVQATQRNIEKELASVALFAPGFHGFIARKMPEQLIYKEALKRSNAVSIFNSITQNPRSTPEGKAYAACGLRKNNQLDDVYMDEKLLTLSVTVLTGDILRKESFGQVMKEIKTRGCF